MDQKTARQPVIRNAHKIAEERGVCGFRRRVITPDDTGVANVTYLRVDDSRYHWHEVMTEFYYVLRGGGTITLDDVTHPVQEGDLVMIPPGVRHTSDGEMDVLIVGVPSLETEDVRFD